MTGIMSEKAIELASATANDPAHDIAIQPVAANEVDNASLTRSDFDCVGGFDDVYPADLPPVLIQIKDRLSYYSIADGIAPAALPTSSPGKVYWKSSGLKSNLNG